MPNRPQYTLRAVLVIVAVLSVPLSCLFLPRSGNTIRPEEQKIIEQVCEYRDSWVIDESGHVTVISIDPLRNRFTDSKLLLVSKLPKLEELYLAFCPITDAGVRHLEECDSLKLLDLGGTKTSTECVENLKRALPDCEIFHDHGPQESR
jgi:hypothetical protein